MVATPLSAKSVLSKKRGDFSKGIHTEDLSEDFFNSLRKVSQTHLKAKVWASNMYIGLLMSDVMERVSKVSDIHGPLIRIFNIFDFPTFFKEMRRLNNDEVDDFTIYKDYLRSLLKKFKVKMKRSIYQKGWMRLLF